MRLLTHRWIVASSVTLGLLFAASNAAAEGVTLNITCGDGSSNDPCLDAVQEWEKRTGNQVNFVSLPSSANEKLSLYQQLLSAGSSDLDVILIDTTWAGILDAHLSDLNTLLPGDLGSGQFENTINNNTVEGRIKALPAYVDSSLLFYRKDLLDKYHREVPKNWDEMEETAAYIQQQERQAGNRIWGYVFQGKSYEGLTCNLLEWTASEGGGVLINEDGQPEVDTPALRRSLERARGWIGGISPQGALSYEEEQSRGVFQSGNSVFMRNWSYAWALAQNPSSPVRDKIGVAPMPAGETGTHRSTLGGWSVAVPRYSTHQKEAADLVALISSKEEQKKRALKLSFMPSYTDLYKDPDILKALPYFAYVQTAVEEAIVRPASVVKTLYPRYTNSIFNRTHSVLGGETSVDDAISRLERDMTRLVRRAEIAAPKDSD